MYRTLAMSAVLLGMAGSSAEAQDWLPARPIQLIVTGPASSPPDLVARWLAEKLPPLAGQPLVVINRPGAAGNIAMQAVAASPPDGYTLVIAGQGPLALNPHMYGRAGYDPIKDFAPITQIERGPLILAVHPDVPAKTLQDLVGLAKKTPKQLSYGSPGTGSPPHMVAELFLRVAGIDVLRVPYPGTPGAMIDLIAGRITFTFGAIPVQMPQVNAGAIRAVAITSKARSPMLPNIPTVAESGYEGFEYQGWLGLAAPAQTPKNITVSLSRLTAKALATTEARAYFSAQGREPVGSTPDAFAAYIQQELDKWGPIIRDAKIRAE